MKKIAFLSLMVLFSVSISSFAQTPATTANANTEAAAKNRPDLAEILKMKRTYISENLLLSDEAAQKFWPIYDKYIADEQSFHKSFKSALDGKGITRDKIKDDTQLTDEQLSFYLDQKMQFKERMFNRDKRFYNDAKSVLSARELKKFYQLEQSFKNQCSKKMHANKAKKAEQTCPAQQPKK